MTKVAYEGEPALLENWGSVLTGSIHDNERARDFGFRRGPVSGQSVALLVEQAIIQFFGKAWFEGGWHDMKFIAATYDDEPVRVVLSEDGGRGYALAVLAPDDRLTCAGRVGLGVEPPWDASADGARAGRAYPSSVIGTSLGSFEFTPGRSVVDRALAPSLSIPWFTGPSPFGGPLMSANGALPATRHGMAKLASDGAREPGMNGGMAMVVERPVLLDQPYRADLVLVDKGESGRTWFRTVGFELFHEGERCAFGRHTSKSWAPA
jgi:hypothetical protein